MAPSDVAEADAGDAPAFDDLPPWEAFEDVPERMPASLSEVALVQPLPVREAALVAAAPAMPSRTEVLKRPEAPLQTTPEGDVWAEVVGQLQAAEAITALVRELALQSQLVAREGDVWRLCVDSESLARPATCERLQAALQAAGHAVRLQVGQGTVTDSPAKRHAQAAAAKMDAAIELIQNDPLVRSLVRDFDAKIVPGSIQPL